MIPEQTLAALGVMVDLRVELDVSLLTGLGESDPHVVVEVDGRFQRDSFLYVLAG